MVVLKGSVVVQRARAGGKANAKVSSKSAADSPVLATLGLKRFEFCYLL